MRPQLIWQSATLPRWRQRVRASSAAPKKQQKVISAHMVTWPSGKAKVCKTFIHQFKSGRHLHKTVIKKMSQSFFFAVSSKIGDFANQFLDTVLQCCPTILGRFAHLDAHFSADFWNLAGEGAIFLRKNRINPAVFRMFSISPQLISRDMLPIQRTVK